MPTVLVAEDDRELLEMYRIWIQDRDGWEVRTATNGDEAVELVDESVDIVILDRRMPIRTGDEVARIVRSSYPSCVVVVVSAFAPDDEIADVDYDRYLTKPFDRDDLVDVLEVDREAV